VRGSETQTAAAALGMELRFASSGEGSGWNTPQHVNHTQVLCCCELSALIPHPTPPPPSRTRRPLILCSLVLSCSFYFFFLRALYSRLLKPCASMVSASSAPASASSSACLSALAAASSRTRRPTCAAEAERTEGGLGVEGRMVRGLLGEVREGRLDFFRWPKRAGQASATSAKKSPRSASQLGVSEWRC